MSAAFLCLFIALAQQTVAPPRDQVRRKDAATVSGRIMERGSSRPLPRIVVSLVKTDSSALLQTITDANGQYRFDDLAPERTRFPPDRIGTGRRICLTATTGRGARDL